MVLLLVLVSVRCYTKGGKIDPSPPDCLSCHVISLIWRQSYHMSLPLALTEQSHCWYCALELKDYQLTKPLFFTKFPRFWCFIIVTNKGLLQMAYPNISPILSAPNFPWYFKILLHVFLYPFTNLWMHTCTCCIARVGIRTTQWSQCSLSTVWSLKIKVRSSIWAACAFTRWKILIFFYFKVSR